MVDPARALVAGAQGTPAAVGTRQLRATPDAAPGPDRPPLSDPRCPHCGETRLDLLEDLDGGCWLCVVCSKGFVLSVDGREPDEPELPDVETILGPGA